VADTLAFLSEGAFEAERGSAPCSFRRYSRSPALCSHEEEILSHSHPLIEYGRMRIAEAKEEGNDDVRACLEGD